MYINGITQYVFFFVWLLLLNIMGLIHMVYWQFISFYCGIIFQCMAIL